MHLVNRGLFRKFLLQVQIYCNSQVQDVVLNKIYESLKNHGFAEPVVPVLNRPLLYVPTNYFLKTALLPLCKCYLRLRM